MRVVCVSVSERVCQSACIGANACVSMYIGALACAYVCPVLKL